MRRAAYFAVAILLALAAAACDPGASLIDASAADAGVDAPAGDATSD